MSMAVGIGSTKRDVPPDTKRAMRAAHLIGKILKAHFDDNLCEVMTERSFDWRSYSLNILDNLLLVGGIPRDILLNTEVKDIDITFNLRELTKIQLNHLRKYHGKKQYQSVNCKCAYWQHYLNQFEPENELVEAKNQEQENTMIKFHDCSYIFNARYFVDIIAESPELRDKVDINDIPEHGFISCTIIDDVMHEGISLKGQKFEFTDTFDSEHTLSIQKLMQKEVIRNVNVTKGGPSCTMAGTLTRGGPSNGNNGGNGSSEDASHKKSRWKSLALFPQQDLNLWEEFDSEFRTIDIEVYPEKVREKLECYDFSINTAVIPLSSITEFCDSEEEVKIAIWFWEYIVENGLDDINAIMDIKHRVLRVPQPNKDSFIIRLHPTTYHFWRTIELMIRLPNFYIADDLIRAHVADYENWLNVEYFSAGINRNQFIHKFREMVNRYCKNVKDVRAMLHTLEILQFNDRFCQILREIKELNGELMSAIQMTDNQQILVIFSSYGYPFLYGLNTVQQHQYNERYGVGTVTTTDAQKQEQELHRLRSSNLELQSENMRLRAEMEGLKEAKTTLAINSAKAIDELRMYLVQSHRT